MFSDSSETSNRDGSGLPATPLSIPAIGSQRRPESSSTSFESSTWEVASLSIPCGLDRGTHEAGKSGKVNRTLSNCCASQSAEHQTQHWRTLPNGLTRRLDIRPHKWRKQRRTWFSRTIVRQLCALGLAVGVKGCESTDERLSS